MSFTVPVPAGEPVVAAAAFDAGEAAEILALVSELLVAEPEAGTAAARFLAARGTGPLPAATWLAEGAARLAGELEAALSHAGIACDRVLDRYRRQPS